MLFGWKLLFNFESKNPSGPALTSQQTENRVDLLIDDGKEVKNFQIEFKQGMTAFDVLKNKAEELGLDLKTEQYDFGIFIKAINGVENGADKKYWTYYVNGQLPMVSSDKNTINSGDKIEFKFEKSPF